MYIRRLFKSPENKKKYQFSSLRNHETIHCCSSLALSCCFYLDFIVDIERFSATPEGFYYLHKGKEYFCQPDFLVQFKNGNKQYIEVRSQLELETKKAKQHVHSQMKAAKAGNINLLLVTEKQIKQTVLLENLHLLHRGRANIEFNQLHRFLHGTANTKLNQLQKQIIEFITSKGKCRIGDIELAFDIDLSLTLANIILLISSNHVRADIVNSPLDLNTMVSLSGNDNFDSLMFYDESMLYADATQEITENNDIMVNRVESELAANTRRIENNEEKAEHCKGEPVQDKQENVKPEICYMGNHDFGNIPVMLKKEGLERFKLYGLISKELTKGWTKKNLDPLIDKYISAVALSKPSWRTLARWHKQYTQSGNDINIFIKQHHLKGNRSRKVIGDSEAFDKALSQYLEAKIHSIASAYRYYKDYVTSQNIDASNRDIPVVSYGTFNNRVKSFLRNHSS